MRSATVRAAIRRGWVWPMRPRTPRPEFEADLGQLGRLARAGLARDDDDLVVAIAVADVVDPGGDRQLRRGSVTAGPRPGGRRCAPRPPRPASATAARSCSSLGLPRSAAAAGARRAASAPGSCSTQRGRGTDSVRLPWRGQDGVGHAVQAAMTSRLLPSAQDASKSPGPARRARVPVGQARTASPSRRRRARSRRPRGSPGCAAGVTDFGIATLPSCRCQRSTTCAGVLPCASATERDRRVVEQPLTLADRAPGLGHDLMLRVVRAQLVLRQAGVQLDLVDRRDDGRLSRSLFRWWIGEVGHADGPGAAVGVDLLERLPGLDVDRRGSGIGQWIRYRSTNRGRASQAVVERAQRTVIAVIGVPQLGGDEELVASVSPELAMAFPTPSSLP